jgi:hypothetical protein
LESYTNHRHELDPVWNEPYFDEGGINIMMTTYTPLFFNVTGDTNEF